MVPVTKPWSLSSHHGPCHQTLVPVTKRRSLSPNHGSCHHTMVRVEIADDCMGRKYKWITRLLRIVYREKNYFSITPLIASNLFSFCTYVLNFLSLLSWLQSPCYFCWSLQICGSIHIHQIYFSLISNLHQQLICSSCSFLPRFIFDIFFRVCRESF